MSIFNPLSWFHHKDPEKDALKKWQSDAFGSLSGISDFGVGQAKAFGTKGNDIQDSAVNQFRSVLGDNSLGKTLSAPAVNATRDAADASTRQEATMGTGRSGGAIAANQQQQSDVMSKIASLLQGGDVAALHLKNEAGGHLGEISGQDLQTMMQALGISTQASGTLGGLTTSQLMEKDQASKELWSSLIKGIAGIAAAGI